MSRHATGVGAPVRRGVPGLVALASGVLAVPLAFSVRGVAVGLALGAGVAAGLELVEVHRVRAKEAVAGLAAGVVGLGIAVVLAARETLNVSGFVRLYLNPSALEGLWPFLLRGAYNTLRLAVLAEIAGVVLGMLLALSVISRRRLLRAPAVGYIDVFRGTPLLLQLSIIHFGLPFIGIRLEPFTSGAVGLALNSAAYVAEIFRAGIQSVERGQMEAARGLGMPYRAAMRYVIVPQAVRRVIPPLVNEFIALLKDSSLVAFLGTTVANRELLRVARDAYAQTFNATPFVAAGLIYLLMTLPLTRVVGRLERGVRSPT